MKRKRENQESSDNKSIKKVILFCAIVVLLIIISLVIRFFIVFKNSKYDGNARFTVAIVEKKSFRIFSFDPGSNQIAVLTVGGKVPAEPPQRSVGAPIDGTVTVLDQLTIPSEPENALFTIITHPTQTRNDITGVDLIRLYWFAKTVSAKNVQEERITLPGSENDIDKTVSRLLEDTHIIDDNLSIEIVNGTDIPGMATRLERIISNAGGNVVAVSSSHEIERTSKIFYYQKPSYTEAKLQHMLGYPAFVTKTQGIADIKIIIGKDQAETKKF